MARRSLKALLITMIVAMMVGLREATGTAPPPPILTTERVAHSQAVVGDRVVRSEIRNQMPRKKNRLQIRALANDEDLAQVSGIRPLAVTVLIWFLAGVVSGQRLALARVERLEPTEQLVLIQGNQHVQVHQV